MNKYRLRAEILALRDVNGLVNPDICERWASKHPGSELHGQLEWNNAVAGRSWRIYQIRQLISMFVVEVTGVREFVSLSIDRSAGGGYRTTEAVVSTEDLRAVMMQDALADLDRLKHKYHLLTELAAVWRAADEARLTPPRPKGKRKPPKKAPRSPRGGAPRPAP